MFSHSTSGGASAESSQYVLWGLVVLAMVSLYQMYRAQCLVDRTAALAAGSEGFRNRNRRVGRERLSQGNVPTYLDSMVPTRESQWDLLGAENSGAANAAYKGSSGIARSDKDHMVKYLESLRGNQSPVQVGGKTCNVSRYNNCPQNLAYQCERNKVWNDNAVSEAIALSATGALNVPSMDETQLYDILRFSQDGIEPGCANAAVIGKPGAAGFRQRRRGGSGENELKKLIS